MSHPRQCRSPSSHYLQLAVFVDSDLAVGEPGFQGIHVDLGVPCQRMTGREVLTLDLTAASGAVELQDADPLAVRRERVLTLSVESGRVNLLRVALADEQSPLVVLSQRAEVTRTVVAVPAFVLK